MSIQLQDSSGILWQISTDATGRLTSLSIGPGIAPPLFLNDIATFSSWQVGVTTTGQLTSTAVAAGANSELIAISPGFFLEVTSSGQLVTVPVAVAPGPMPYSYTTLGSVKQQLANRLYDPTMVFWTNAELGAYIFEALRVWNAFTGYWRGEFIFTASQGTTWYDISNISQMSNTLRPYTLKDAWVYTQMQYHLLEPATGVNPWPGSSQFTAADFLGAVARRRDEIISVTGCTTTQRTAPALSKRIMLPDFTIDIRRVAYVPAASSGASPYVLWPEDTWGEMAFNPNYTMQAPGLPATYLRSTQPPITFDADRAPGFGGNFDVLAVNAGPLLSVSAPTTLFIPDDWVDVLKWGALADLLSRESNAKDTLRATYCEQRYRMGMSLLHKAPALLALRRGNVPLWIDSVKAADFFQTGWQSLPQGQPASAFYAGLNLLALSPAADSGTYSFLVTVVENAPIPLSDAAPIQVGRDDLDAIIDYAQHLAAFKQGGDEFTRTMPLLQRFLAQASLYNLKLNEIAEYTRVLYGLGNREKEMYPVIQPDNSQRGGPEE